MPQNCQCYLWEQLNWMRTLQIIEGPKISFYFLHHRNEFSDLHVLFLLSHRDPKAGRGCLDYLEQTGLLYVLFFHTCTHSTVNLSLFWTKSLYSASATQTICCLWHCKHLNSGGTQADGRVVPASISLAPEAVHLLSAHKSINWSSREEIPSVSISDKTLWTTWVEKVFSLFLF